MIRSLLLVSSVLVAFVGCKDKGVGVVPIDATPPATTGTPEAGAAVDINTCAACQALSPTASWTFEGVYRDDKCTVPLAQIATASCGVVPALGQTTLTYVDEHGTKKAGESAQVTLTEQIDPLTARYRKTAKGCARANESATALTPPGCAGQRVCRDDKGALVCTGCRTFANGCPDFEETRMYAAIDEGAKPAAGGGGGGNVARLKQCCAQLSAEAKRLGPSPEAGLLNNAAAQCMAIAAAAGPNGTAPELGAIRTLLAGRNIPPICAGF
jgi:hypothetical protein